MSDIFGRNPDDYEVIRARREAGALDEWMAREAERRGVGPHDFSAFGAMSREAAVSDAQASGYITNNMMAIQTAVDEIMYREFRLPEMLSINTSIPEGAQTYAYRVRNYVGEAQRISAPGHDAPTATASETLISHPLFYYGLDAEWTIDELRGAMFGGFPLDTESLAAAVRGTCLLYTSPSPRDRQKSRMPSSA